VRDRVVDIRLIAATHQDLGRLIAENRFREDLYYRISALELRVPALRERPEDLPLLAREILASFAREVGRPVPEISPSALGVLASHPWPGNVRELRNVLETAALRNRSGTVQPEDLRLRTASSGESPLAISPLAEVEKLHVQRALAATNGHVARAAALLGISTSSLYERIKRLGLAGGEKRKSDDQSGQDAARD
jgi:DNA-binding NtrC family response regulator